MKIKRFNEKIDDYNYIKDKVYYKVYYNVYYIDHISENKLLKLSNNIKELEQYNIDYDIFYKDNNMFLFIYPHYTLYHVFSEDYISSSAKNKEENRIDYLNSGYKNVSINDIELLIQSNKFNI